MSASSTSRVQTSAKQNPTPGQLQALNCSFSNNPLGNNHDINNGETMLLSPVNNNTSSSLLQGTHAMSALMSPTGLASTIAQ